MTTETKTTHTPGPWIYQFSESGGYDCMTDAFLIVDAESRLQFIADVDLSHYGQSWRQARGGLSDERRAEAEANARLIAAAPDLLAACREAFIALPMTKHNEPINAMLKAAIAKAEGRQERNAQVAEPLRSIVNNFSSQPCGCDPGEGYRCARHRGEDVPA